MKFLFVFLVFKLSVWDTGHGLAIDVDLDPNDNLDEDEFMGTFGEEINDPVEKQKRSEALKRHEDNVKRVNREFIEGKRSFVEKINPYSDLPMDEFVKEKTGLLEENYGNYGRGLIPMNKTDEESERYFDQFRYSRGSTPSSFSSVENGHVTPIRNQRKCGSCVAFASVAVMETLFAKITGVFTDYSEQELLDCGYGRYGSDGCKGAGLDTYFSLMVYDKRLPMHESFYPYKTRANGAYCPAKKPYKIGARITRFHFTGRGDEETLKKLVAEHGAVVVVTTTDVNWENYRGGILDICQSNDINKPPPNGLHSLHALAVVGYGSEVVMGRLKDYWLLKNSWGKNWGDKGWIKLERGVGRCGIGQEYAVLMAEANPGPTDPILPDFEPCEDDYSDCPVVARTNCKGYHTSCKKSCGMCKGMTPHPSYYCPDQFNNCQDLARQGACNHFVADMPNTKIKEKCCVSCRG